jgi:hypothetical protein
MSHEEMHLPLHLMGKCMGNFPLTIILAILPFTHFNQSMPLHVTRGNAFAFSFHGKIYEESSIGHSIWPFTSQTLTFEANDI